MGVAVVTPDNNYYEDGDLTNTPLYASYSCIQSLTQYFILAIDKEVELTKKTIQALMKQIILFR